ncbi:MAG: barstar family protein [Saprospiraceae bacterium]|nr:barstar family protein [Saprospiraceae bacterium]
MSASHFHLLSKPEQFQNLKFRNAFVVKIDGECSRTSADLYLQLESQFEFPEFFGKNLDALYDCLMDLEWITKDRIIIYFERTDLLLSQELTDPDILEDFLVTLHDVCVSWEVGAEALISPKTVSVYFSYANSIVEILDSNDIEYDILD